jgi:inhibitor of nuclear factor kappa-B kinase subunit alpha
MEYCSGGDLRQVLLQPQHCTGLEEKQIRNILLNISSAIIYLHDHRIIHRDLKPENVVIQITSGGKKIYKLIDLGYCKELDSSSLCSSFVGTLQYLAPELFTSKNYTSSVDNWSFGILAYEIITGHRPFLPHMTPAQWIPIVSKKSSIDISAYYDPKTKAVSFSSQIFGLNHISKSFKELIETWLRAVLEWDPKKRCSKKALKNLKDDILLKCIVNVFIVDSLETFSYEITQEMTLAEFQVFIDSNSKIVSKDQLILAHDKNDSLICVNDRLDKDKASVFYNLINTLPHFQLFVFSRSKKLIYSPYSTTRLIPQLMETILLNPTSYATYDVQRSCWKEFVWLANQLVIQFGNLFQSLNLLAAYYSSFLSTLRDQIFTLIVNQSKLNAKVEMFKSSMIFHLKQLETCCKNQINAQLLSICNKTLSILNESMTIDEEIKTFLIDMKDFEKKLIKICSEKFDFDPFSPNTHDFEVDSKSIQIVNIYQSMLKNFTEMRSMTKDQRINRIKLIGSSSAFDNMPMVKLICDLFQLIEKRIKAIYEAINGMLEGLEKQEAISKIIAEHQSQLKKKHSSLKTLQINFNQNLWLLFSEALKFSKFDDLSEKVNLKAKLDILLKHLESNEASNADKDNQTNGLLAFDFCLTSSVP